MLEQNSRRHLVKFMLVFLIFNLSACASVSDKPVQKNQWQQFHAEELPDGKGWWFARFRLDWPENELPKWYLGTMLAGEVIAPVLQQHREQITLWRFHRRAVRDGYDHVFSFIFYSSPQTARDIYSALEQDSLLNGLKQQNKITWTGFDTLNEISKPDIQDTSDKTWPDAIQKTWPAFIMGASQMWLGLVKELANELDSGQDTELLYEQVHNQLTALWVIQGQHTLFHHLSALYAYQPLLIRY